MNRTISNKQLLQLGIGREAGVPCCVELYDFLAKPLGVGKQALDAAIDSAFYDFSIRQALRL